MHLRFRKFLAFALSALLVLTGQSLAASRGLNAATGQMEICTGTGPVVVYVDAEGQPTQAPHYCPEFALALLGAVVPETPELPAASDRMRPQPPEVVQSQDFLQTRSATARAPPLTT